MRQYKQLILWVFLICVIIVAEAQQQSPILRKRNFNDAKRFILFSNYTAALPLLLNLQRADTLNANLNYLAGLCYLNISFEKEKSISYFKAASQNMSPKYKELRFKEKKSPYKTIYHLGQAYQFAYQFDKADKSPENPEDNHIKNKQPHRNPVTSIGITEEIHRRIE